MKDEGFKKIIEQSEVTTNFDFTDKVIAEIEAQKQEKESVFFWTLPKIAISFIGIAIISGVLMTGFLPKVFSSTMLIPIMWAFLLLIGLNHVLTLHSYKSLLKTEA